MKFWRKKGFLACVLWPLSFVYYLLMRFDQYRKIKQQVGCQKTAVVVVGNITAGGTGKTPFVHALVNWLQQHGKQVAVVSRGYQAQCKQFPCLVTTDSESAWVGDEALLHAINLNIPVVIDPDRQRAIDYINQHYTVDVIISDDGLQHWGLKSDFEMLLVDGQLGFSNTWLLPAGPLREPLTRLQRVDMCLIKNRPEHISLKNTSWPYFLISAQGLFNQNQQAIEPESLLKQSVTLITSIANPESFYRSLQQFLPQLFTDNCLLVKRQFRDHKLLTPNDIKVDSGIVIMTEKDAVKCMQFDLPFYYFKISAQLSQDIQSRLSKQLLPIIEKTRV